MRCERDRKRVRESDREKVRESQLVSTSRQRETSSRKSETPDIDKVRDSKTSRV